MIFHNFEFIIRYNTYDVNPPTINPTITSVKKWTPRYILLYPTTKLQKNKYLIFLWEIKNTIDAKEKVDDACDDAKPNFPPQPETTSISPFKSLIWHGLSLSKNGFIIELVIKSEIKTAIIQIETCTKYLLLL